MGPLLVLIRHGFRTSAAFLGPLNLFGTLGYAARMSCVWAQLCAPQMRKGAQSAHKICLRDAAAKVKSQVLGTQETFDKIMKQGELPEAQTAPALGSMVDGILLK
jgi:hypothetical protein